MTVVKKIVIIIMLILAAILFYSYNSGGEKYSKFSGAISKQDEKEMTVDAFMKRVVSTNNKVLLVYFHADWCIPCVKLKPEIDELEKDPQTIYEVLKIDTDDNPKIAEYFEINSLPMFVIYKNGKKVWENTGYLSKSQLVAKIEMYK